MAFGTVQHSSDNPRITDPRHAQSGSWFTQLQWCWGWRWECLSPELGTAEWCDEGNVLLPYSVLQEILTYLLRCNVSWVDLARELGILRLTCQQCRYSTSVRMEAGKAFSWASLAVLCSVGLRPRRHPFCLAPVLFLPSPDSWSLASHSLAWFLFCKHLSA